MTVVDEPIHVTLRSVRRSVGVSLDTLAVRSRHSKGYLSKVETGQPGYRVTPELAEDYDNALGTGGLLLDLVLAGQDGDELKRRRVLIALHSAAALAVTNPRLLAESLRSGLLDALDLDDWRDVASEYGRRFMTDRPDTFKSNLSVDLTVLRQSLVDSDRPEARRAAPLLMTLYGMAISNAGDVDGGHRWYRAARVAADRTEDPQIRQLVRGREAFRRGYEGATPAEVLAIADGVDDVEAHLAVAQAFARLGQHSRSNTALVNARSAFERGNQSETTIFAMPPWRMALSEAYVYALAGDISKCDASLAAVAPPPVVQRWEAQLSLQRAVAHARAGDMNNARALASLATRGMPKEESSIVVTEMLNEIRRCLPPAERHI